MFPLAKFSVMMPATVTSTVTHECTCLGHLGGCDKKDPISVVPPKVAKARSHVSLSLVLSPINVTNANNIYYELNLAVFTLAKVSMRMPATVTLTVTHECTCLGHLGRCDQKDPISVVPPKVAKVRSHVSLLLVLSPINVTNVNKPLL